MWGRRIFPSHHFSFLLLLLLLSGPLFLLFGEKRDPGDIGHKFVSVCVAQCRSNEDKLGIPFLRPHPSLILPDRPHGRRDPWLIEKREGERDSLREMPIAPRWQIKELRGISLKEIINYLFVVCRAHNDLNPDRGQSNLFLGFSFMMMP